MLHRISHRALVALALGAALAVSPSLRADNGSTEDLFLGELPHVLGATRLRQPLSETPASVTVIDRQTIEASGALTVPEVLRLVPGFQIGRDAGSWSVVTYHGLSDKYARRMQVLIDGRSVYTPAFGGVVWSDLPLQLRDIDHIEVVRGPNGVAYGANSFAAVINIVTLAPDQDRGTSLHHVNGDWDTRRTALRHAGETGALQYSIGAQHDGDDGIPDDDYANQQRTTQFNVRGEYRLGARDTLEAQIGAAQGQRGEGRESRPSDPARERELTARYRQLRWRRTLDADSEISLLYYHTLQDSSDSYDSSFTINLPPPIPVTTRLREDLRTERSDLEFQHSLRLGDGLRWVWGAEARRDRVTGPGWFGTERALDNDLWRLFGNAEWRFDDDWVANLGFMYEHNDTTGGDLSPRLALNYHLTREHTLRAGYSRAWRTPSTLEHRADTELCAVVLGNPVCTQQILATGDLKPERIDAYELGYIGRLPQQRLVLDMRLYRERIRDVIVWVYDPTIPNSIGAGALTFRNDGYANIDGLDTQVEWRPLDGTRLLATHAVARQHGEVLAEANSETYSRTDRSTPTYTSSLLLMQKLPWNAEASAFYYRMSNMRWLDQGADDDTGTIRNLDAHLAWKFRHGGTRGSIALSGQNLLGEYFDYRKSTLLDERIVVQLNLQFP